MKRSFSVNGRPRFGLPALVAVAAEGPRLYRMALLGSGFSAQFLCAWAFISGRDEKEARASD